MREIVLFAAGAAMAGTIFFVALIELFFTVKRRKSYAALSEKVQEIKTNYNQSLNGLVKEEEEKLQAADAEKAKLKELSVSEKEKVSKEYESKLKELQEESERALEQAKKKAKKLEQEAKMKAESYLESRKEEVEQELMSLVMSVTKKVLPDSLTYEVQKELVVKALQEAKTGSVKAGGHD